MYGKNKINILIINWPTIDFVLSGRVGIGGGGKSGVAFVDTACLSCLMINWNEVLSSIYRTNHYNLQ